MDYVLVTGPVLVLGLALAIVAQWKGWRPSLPITLAVGIGFRVLIMWLSAIDTWQPVDFVLSFKPAGEAIVERKDPVLESNGGWHFLPTIPYMYGLLLWLGIPWEYTGRLVTVVSDIILIPLVGKLAGGEKAGLRAFQYACNPVAILVASVHGQVEPVSLVFGVAAFLFARKARESEPVRNALLAGLLMGLALCAKSWPIWLIPGMLLFLPDLRTRVIGFLTTGFAPLFFLVTLPIGAGTSLDQLPEVIRIIRHVRPVVGEWGWTALIVEGTWTLRPDLATIGQILIYVTLPVIAVLFRKADPIDLTTAMLLAFMIVTPRMGAQYLMWFMPFLVARPSRFAWPAIIGVSVWAGLGYCYLTQYESYEWWLRHTYWAQASIILLPLLLNAIPWERRSPGRLPAAETGELRPAATGA